MKLEKNHREALLAALKVAKAEAIKTEKCIAQVDDHLRPFFEIDGFLIDQRIELIKKSLIENEIDN